MLGVLLGLSPINLKSRSLFFVVINESRFQLKGFIPHFYFVRHIIWVKYVTQSNNNGVINMLFRNQLDFLKKWKSEEKRRLF